jgi:hypothetical protein
VPRRVVAVDWSGRAQGAQRAIWLAEVRDGVVTSLEDGRTRDEVAAFLVALAAEDRSLVVGLDFSFSLPAWFLRRQGLGSAPELWDVPEADLEAWLRCDAPPFWGRPGRPRPELPAHLRVTEQAVGPVAGIRPKSTFQVSGAGSVGTGSLRGFPVLRALRAAGFAIWPFDDATPPFVVEIWPRLLTGAVRKSDRNARAAYLERFERNRLEGHTTEAVCHVPNWARERAATSQDAFDALVSAVVMARRSVELASLHRAGDAVEQLEGTIWSPS